MSVILPKHVKSPLLPPWEQPYLKEIVCGNAPQVSFAAAGYGEFDGQCRPFGSGCSNSTGGSNSGMYGGSSETLFTPSQSSSAVMSGGLQTLSFLTAPSSKSISYGMAGLRSSSESNVVRALYGEGSGPNKRPHVELPPQQMPGQSTRVNQSSSQTSSQGTFQGSQPANQAPFQPTM